MTAPLPPSEVIRLIEAAGENAMVDAKGPMRWDGADESGSLTKDILACANSTDGGAIVIGKRQTATGFEFLGLSEDQAATFETTRVAQWVNARCEPPVKLTCHHVDHGGKRFVVVTVAEFSDVPIICTRGCIRKADGKPLLTEGAIYVRTPNAESAPLRKPHDVRTLVGLATRKQADVLISAFEHVIKGRPLVPSKPPAELYDPEILAIRGSLDKSLGEEAAKGCWKLTFFPAGYRPDRWTKKDLKAAVTERSVRLRRSFPPLHDMHLTEWGVESVTAEDGFGMTTSGAVFAARVFRENYEPYRSRERPIAGPPDPDIPAAGWLDLQSTIWSLTEIFLFLSRLATLLPSEDVVYSLEGTRLEGRRVVTLDHTISWWPSQPCRVQRFRWARTGSAEELRAGWREECAAALEDLFQYFEEGELEAAKFLPHIDAFIQRR